MIVIFRANAKLIITRVDTSSQIVTDTTKGGRKYHISYEKSSIDPTLNKSFPKSYFAGLIFLDIFITKVLQVC